MDKPTYDAFLSLLLDLPGWRDQRSRAAFIQGTFWGSPILDRVNLTGGPADVAADLLQACQDLDAPTDAGFTPRCQLLVEIRRLVGTGGRRDPVIAELEAKLCQPTANTKTTAEAQADAVPSVLFLAAEPSDAARLRVSAEHRAIDEQLRQARHRDRVQLLPPVLATRAVDLNRVLLEERPDIVHFAGHGQGSEGIYLEDETGSAKLATTEALSALFRPLAGRTRVVILNACRTAAQAEALVAHLDYAVGTREPITDAAATAFSIGFYQAVGARASLEVEAAFQAGCAFMQLEGTCGQHIPILYRKAGEPLACA
jgi:hypothetical protein